MVRQGRQPPRRRDGAARPGVHLPRETDTAERRAAYEAFIASPEWRSIKARYRASDLPQVCVLCGVSEALHMHHRTYVRFGGAELLTDLMPLCEGHHTAYHEGRLSKKARRKYAATERSLLQLAEEAAYEGDDLPLLSGHSREDEAEAKLARSFHRGQRVLYRGGPGMVERIDGTRVVVLFDVAAGGHVRVPPSRLERVPFVPPPILAVLGTKADRRAKRAHETRFDPRAIDRPCKNCGKATRRRTRRGGVFCSDSCSRNHG